MKHEGLYGFMDDFLTVHPNATFPHVHRDPHTTIASMLRLGAEIGRPYLADMTGSDHMLHVIERLSRMLHRYMWLRDHLNFDDRIVDMAYEQIRSDPMPAFRKLYERAGHELTPACAELMLEYERANEQGKHGAHTYSLEMFGLTDRMIDQYFAEYLCRFILT